MKTLIAEKVVEEVVMHQFKSAKEATDVEHSVELAGFGKLFFNEKKAQRKLKKIEKFVEDMKARLPETEKKEKMEQMIQQYTEQKDQLNKLISHD